MNGEPIALPISGDLARLASTGADQVTLTITRPPDDPAQETSTYKPTPGVVAVERRGNSPAPGHARRGYLRLISCQHTSSTAGLTVRFIRRLGPLTTRRTTADIVTLGPFTIAEIGGSYTHAQLMLGDTVETEVSLAGPRAHRGHGTPAATANLQ